ncbi:hypothetical protein ACFTUC_39755 [Streptomyces sp. NPDC056944]|uniref:hypothetical protein n=1 Tax=Streptomyces sp. NPDC056944 TaxID=3345972 RepID=UPI003641E227
MWPILGELEDNSGPFTLDGSEAMPLEVGDPRQIGAFRLLGVLGSGGTGGSISALYRGSSLR